MKLRKKRVVGLCLVLFFFVLGIFFLVSHFGKKNSTVEILMLSFENKTIQEVKEFAEKNGLQFEIQYVYDNEKAKDQVISQNISEGKKITREDSLIVVVSKGMISKEELQEASIDELGKVPIMMYHGIINQKNSETAYTGGNVDKEGYNRTTEAFRKDLEFYYQNDYRMIRLIDYVEGKIDVPFGKSPIILTFDDGREDNFKVLGKEKGELKIDPNCAVGILEEFKKKYPDFNVTATFFVNQGIFQQKEYNKEILEWLVSHGYDIGNHTMTHPDFTKISLEKSHQEVGNLYAILDELIPSKYVPIVALPFGSPYKISHSNYKAILKSEYNATTYTTKAALRVGWEAELSCFHQDFAPTFLKRIRAYDNDDSEFDIAMSFRLLEKTRYRSDGDPKTITVPKAKEDQVQSSSLKVIAY